MTFSRFSVRDGWLMHGLLDFYAYSESPDVLEIILDAQEPHDRFLFDRLSESLKSGGKSRLQGLTLLGYVVRRQPPWLYKLTQHTLMKELIKVLKVRNRR